MRGLEVAEGRIVDVLKGAILPNKYNWSKIGQSRSKVGLGGYGKKGCALVKIHVSCRFDLFCPRPEKPSLDLFLSNFNFSGGSGLVACSGGSGLLARPQDHNP